jgi:hypothetical protein
MVEAGFLWNRAEKRPYTMAEISFIMSGAAVPDAVEVLQVQLKLLQLTPEQRLVLANRLADDIMQTEDAQLFVSRLSLASVGKKEIKSSNHHKIASFRVDESSTIVAAKERMMAGSGLSQKGTERLVQLYRYSLTKLGYGCNPVGAALYLQCPEEGPLGFTRDALISVHENEIGPSWGPVLTAGDWSAIAQTCYIPSWWEGNRPILSEIRFLGDVLALKYAVENSNHLC